ncbi:MAG: hypothetical protein U0Y10_14340 [Spirosomataceae bacterium]
MNAQSKYLVGSVLDERSGKGVEGAIVTNQRTKQMTRTTAEGKFLLWAAANDSILVSSLTHGRLGIRWDGTTKNPLILVKEQAIALQEVSIISKKPGTVNKEIQQLLNERKASLKLSGEEVLDYAAGGSVISLLYDMFSKEGKSRRKLAVLLQQERREKLINFRFNPQTVAQITKLKWYEVESFMYFCSFTDDFVLRSTDYELTHQILVCLQEYNALKAAKLGGLK